MPPVPGQLGFGALFENRDSRQYLAFYELQEGATASGDVGNLVGGAFLEFVEGKVLPAVAILEERAKA